MKKNKVLRVGFDLDGVLLYNPARIARPLIVFVKKLFFKRREKIFYIPSSSSEKLLWHLLHKSSLFIAPGLNKIKELVKSGKIKAYIITARYSFMQEDLDYWLEKMEAKKYFKGGCFTNKKNKQPMRFKERIIREQKLDIFVEDNWDIVTYLRDKFKVESSKFKVFWIYNILDAWIKYPYKFSVLKKAVEQIEREVYKKKVLVVTDFFYPHWTGISKSIFNLTQALKDNFDFTVLTVRFDKSLKREENVKNVKIIRQSYLFSLSRAKYSASLVFKFMQEVGRHEVVFINSPFTNILPIALLAKLFGKKLLIFHQGDLVLPKGAMNRFIEKIFELSTRIAFVLANKISTYTEDYARNSRVMTGFMPKFTPLVMPVDLMGGAKKGISTARTKGALTGMNSRQDPSNHIVFGFAGRFVEEKGFDILIDAIPEVLRKLPSVQFVFAGQTKMEYEKTFENLESKILNLKSNLKLLGLLNNKELAEFYKNIDFIVIPSRSDCFNLVQAEAVLYGKPSIVSDIPGARVMVRETGFGLLFEKGNSDDLANKLVDVARNKAKFLENYEKVVKFLDNEINAKKIKKYFRG